MKKGPPAKFVRQYADIGGQITAAIEQFALDVRNGNFPSGAESYATPAGLID
jgi:ketopantoate hydroxymethyltransferase